MTETKRPTLNFFQIMNMSLGFFGIQHGFEIQFARMTPLFETLGAEPGNIPFLWLAAPLTGFIIQPIVGYMSDRTWWPAWRSRRRPYFFVGAVLATFALMAMPYSGTIWMAAGLLWVLDASLNICMEPMRAFVGDKLSTEQRPKGYAWQAFMIGIGTISGNWIASYYNMHYGFMICGTILFVAMMWTIFSTPEYPPEDPQAFEKEKAESKGAIQFVQGYFGELISCTKEMPQVMVTLAVVQFFTWMGLFCMWIFYSSSVGVNVFGGNPSAAPGSELAQLYESGVQFAAQTFAVRGLATPLWALLIPILCARIGRSKTHALSLLLGAAGLVMVVFVGNRDQSWMLYFFAIGSGIAWASIVSMPYTILIEHLPKGKFGIFMGLFNMFIVIPEIIVSLGVGGVMLSVVGGNRAAVVAMGGALLAIAAVVTLTLKRYDEPKVA